MPSQNNHWKNFFFSPWFLVGAILLIFGLLFNFSRSFYQDYQVRAEIRQLQDEARNLSAKKLESLEILKYVQSRQFAEEKARTELNLVKPGEQVAIIKSTGEAKRGGQTDVKMIEWDNVPNPVKWWRYFFSN